MCVVSIDSGNWIQIQLGPLNLEPKTAFEGRRAAAAFVVSVRSERDVNFIVVIYRPRIPDFL